MLRDIVLKLFDSSSSSQRGEPCPILSCERLSLLGKLLLKAIMVLAPVNLLTCAMFRRRFLSFHQLSQFFVATVPALSERVAGI